MLFRSAIHTVDREKLARRIADMAQQLGRCPDLFIQVNTGEEPQKAGILPADTDAFVETVRAMDLTVAGLMCIPPVEETPSCILPCSPSLPRATGSKASAWG